jgi:vancomycin resistance protein YoaR
MVDQQAPIPDPDSSADPGVPVADATMADSRPGDAEPGGTPPAGPKSHSGRRAATRFSLAFAFGLLAVLAIAAGALAAYESSNVGRIVPGVRVGPVDLSGLSPSQAAARLRESYAALGEGQLILAAAGRERTISYTDLGRRIDADRIVAQAMAIGRDGPAVERITASVRTLVSGLRIEPAATIDGATLRSQIAALARDVEVAPVDAAVTIGDLGFGLTLAANGRRADVDKAFRIAESVLLQPYAPASTRVDLPVGDVAPSVTNEEASAAREAARRVAVDVTLVNGGESWVIPGTAFRGWISFGVTADGAYAPVIAREGLEAGLAAIADSVSVTPVSATFLVDGKEQVVGVTDAKPGRSVDIPNTVATLEKLIAQRAMGLSVSRVPISLTVIEPELTTAEASKSAPLMRPISQWTTYFPIGVRNGQGANIWIPARDIDGQVVMPGGWFDFWKAIGPVTRERGYKDGGAIIDGHTEPQGALAGGICSCSTTLFNAALRAGLQMGARLNHYYYIDRYPLGLDATVFESSSGSVQTMSFRNDTSAPILIRGTGWSVGGKGYVRFVLWSVPTGRVVTFSAPIVKNVRKATDSTVYTTDLAPGVKERTEYPTDGKDVWVTRTVRDAAGTLIHEETYYSHYATITGILQIGVAPSSTLSPTPTPTP